MKFKDKKEPVPYLFIYFCSVSLRKTELYFLQEGCVQNARDRTGPKIFLVFLDKSSLWLINYDRL